MKENTKINIVLTIDESGSMEPQTLSVISGLNEFIGMQKKEFKESNQEIIVTMITFNQNAKVVFTKNLKDVPEITKEHYNPNGMTALYAGIHAIKDVPNLGKCIILIWTDGEENSSDPKLYTRENTKEYLKQLTDSGCSITYMGADFDAYQSGSKLGLSASQTVNYSSKGEKDETPQLFLNLGRQTSQVCRGTSSGIQMNQDDYTDNFNTPSNTNLNKSTFDGAPPPPPLFLGKTPTMQRRLTQVPPPIVRDSKRKSFVDKAEPKKLDFDDLCL